MSTRKIRPFRGFIRLWDAGEITKSAYDPATGRRIVTTDALTNSTYTSYDPQGRTIATWGATYPVGYAYDVYGRHTAMQTWRDTNSTPDVTQWLYDEATGLLTNKFYADGKGPSYTYTPQGQLATRTWARGIVSTYSYERASGSMTGIAYSDGTPGVSFTLDRLGRQTAISDGTGIRSFTYNDALQLTAETNAFGGLTRTDDETGLLYYGFRFYVPPLGRFANRDPIGEQGGNNIYVFVGNEPVDRFDRFGLLGADPSTYQLTFTTDKLIGFDPVTSFGWPHPTYYHMSGTGNHDDYTQETKLLYDWGAGLCNTPFGAPVSPHMSISARNNSCCRKHRFYCSYHYKGHAEGTPTASQIASGTTPAIQATLTSFWLGVAATPNSGTTVNSGSLITTDVEVWLSKVGDLVIPHGGEREIIKLSPYLHAGGNGAKYTESAEVTCHAECVDGP